MITVLICPPWVAFSMRSVVWSPSGVTMLTSLSCDRSGPAAPLCPSVIDHASSGITTPSMIT